MTHAAPAPDFTLKSESGENVRLAEQHNVPLCADPSSVRLTYKLSPYLSQLHLLVPNHAEAAE